LRAIVVLSFPPLQGHIKSGGVVLFGFLIDPPRGGRKRFWNFPAQLLLLICMILAVANNGYAGEISVLAPYGESSKLLSRNRIINIVVKVTDANDLDRVVLQTENGSRVYDPDGRYQKGGAYFLHYSVSLRKGDNHFVLDPPHRPINIRFTPLSSLLNLDLGQSGIYLFHRKDVIPGECKGCHTEKLPAGVEISDLGYGRYSPSCYSCHQAKVVASEWKHSPASALLCRSCHRDDSSYSKVAVPSGKIETLCFGCHVNDRKWTEMRHIHGPVGTGDCTICHDPHGSKSKFQLWTDGKAALCVVCHEDKKKYVTEQVKQKLKVHGILRARGCVICHSPHATDYRFQLYGEVADLCTSCHTGLQGVERGHPAQGHPMKGVEDPLRPGRELSCTSCHNPHGSDYDHLLIGSTRGGLVCTKCHNSRKKKDRYDRYGR